MNEVQITQTDLIRPEKPLGTSGVKFFTTSSNMAGPKGLPVSITVASFFFKLDPRGMSNSFINSAKAVNVGYPA